MKLSSLNTQELIPTRNYLQDLALAIGSLQRGFLPEHPRQWQYGLEVSMRGICTQAFEADGKEHKALIDLVKNKIRFDERTWDLSQISGGELFDELQSWAGKFNVELEKPEFAAGKFDVNQAKNYAEALWWLHDQFTIIKKEFKTGSTAPIFLYPHHFDLALVWFPWDDDRQIGIGFSTGDENIKEPYIYLTVYPEPTKMDESWLEKLPQQSYWNKAGFSGAVLPYAELQAATDPEELLRHFVGPFSTYAVANGF